MLPADEPMVTACCFAPRVTGIEGRRANDFFEPADREIERP